MCHAGQTLPALALDNATSHVHSLLWQNIQPVILKGNELWVYRERSTGTH